MNKLKEEQLPTESVKEILKEVLPHFADQFSVITASLLKTTESTNKRIDRVCTAQEGLNNNISGLVKILAVSEERQNQHAEKTDRLEQDQKDSLLEFKEYKINNDEKVIDLEKQVMLLEADKESKDKSKDNSNSIKNKVIAGLAVIVLLAILKMVSSSL
jgi:hypothetical protein